MKIIKLVSENIKRLHAVEITPDGTLVIVGGRNGAGKSSVLDSIAYALGGEKLVPSEPIRLGESEAKVVIDLDDLVVTRKFKRQRRSCDCAPDRIPALPPDAPEHDITCAARSFGETQSQLVVTNKDGARYPSPQALLDKLLGKLAFDPLEFSREDPPKQAEILRTLVGLDVSDLEALRKEAYDERARVKKAHDVQVAQLTKLPHYANLPDQELSLAEISEELAQAERIRQQAEAADRKEAGMHIEAERAKANLDKQDTLIHDQEARLELLHRERIVLARQNDQAHQVWRHAAAEAERARSTVPDLAAIRGQITEAEAVNAKVRANQAYQQALAEAARLEADIAVFDEQVRRAIIAKRERLAAVRFPVPDLGLNDEGVTFRGVPFDQASSSEQLRVSVAIGLALNPKLKILLIRSGNLLDEDSLKLVAEQAAQAEAQVWCEWVTKSPEGVSVLLEEGQVVHDLTHQ